MSLTLLEIAKVLAKFLHLMHINQDKIRYVSDCPLPFQPYLKRYFSYGIHSIDSKTFLAYGKSRAFNDELIKDKFYVTDRNPCIFMTQPPTTICNNKTSIIFLEGLIKSKPMKVDLIRCAIANKTPLIIYDYSEDLIKQRVENSQYYIQKFMIEIFQKFTDVSKKNIIITMGDSYLELLKFLLWEETHKQLEKNRFNILNIAPYLDNNELKNMSFHIENYIISHLHYIITKRYKLWKENTREIDNKFLSLMLNLRRITDILLPTSEGTLENMQNLLSNKQITRHWIYSKNELFLNTQHNIDDKMKKIKEIWKPCPGGDHFYSLNQFSVLRQLNIKINPIVSILSALLKHPESL